MLNDTIDLNTADRPALRAAVRQLPDQGRLWFWRPQRHWFGWKTLIPVRFGHDEFARQTILLGWTVTGRMIIAIRDCRSVDCYRESIRNYRDVVRFGAETEGAL
ncbi:hypothetical protein ACFVAJ_17305 [Agromyces sp. NPDC057679]|uniref:hypothetical protein n=1 Tax=Agromyces sp. NPDC057679 TaxID=3346207 RepID=UPI00366C45A5